MKSQRTINSKFEFALYDKNDRLDFIKAHFSSEHVEAYERLIPGAYKADLWRYCILYIKGRIYMDIDMRCLNEIKLPDDVDFIAPIDLNSGYSYDVYRIDEILVGNNRTVEIF